MSHDWVSNDDSYYFLVSSRKRFLPDGMTSHLPFESMGGRQIQWRSRSRGQKATDAFSHALTQCTVKHSLNTQESTSMWGPFSIVRGLLITKSQLDLHGIWQGVSESPCCPTIPPIPIALPGPSSIEDPLFPPHELLKAPPTHQHFIDAVSLHLTFPLPGTCFPLLLLPDTSLHLFLAMYTLGCQLFSESCMPGCLQRFVLTCYCRVCAVCVFPANSGLLLGRDLCCSLP